MFVAVFGWVAAAIGVASNLPQLLRILTARTSAGVSVRLWQVTAASTAAWCVHGFLVSAPQMQWPNLLMSLLASSIVVLVLRDSLSILPTANAGASHAHGNVPRGDRAQFHRSGL